MSRVGLCCVGWCRGSQGGVGVEEKSEQRSQSFPEQLAQAHSALSRDLRAPSRALAGPCPHPPVDRESPRCGWSRGSQLCGGVVRGPAVRRRGQRQKPAAAYWPPRGPAGGAVDWVPLGRSRAAGEAGSAGAGQPMGARPSSSYKGPERGRGGGGEVGRGEARLAEEKLRPGPGRATNGGGGTMEAAAAAPRRRLLLILLVAAAATLLPGTKGERQAGGRAAAGRAGRARPLAGFCSFSNMARGRGRRWRRPAGRAFLTRQAPREPRRGGEAGRGRCQARVAERREAGPLRLPGGSDGLACGGRGLPLGAQGWPGRWPRWPFPSAPGPGAAGAWAGTGVEALGGSERGGLPRGS